MQQRHTFFIRAHVRSKFIMIFMFDEISNIIILRTAGDFDTWVTWTHSSPMRDLSQLLLVFHRFVAYVSTMMLHLVPLGARLLHITLLLHVTRYTWSLAGSTLHISRTCSLFTLPVIALHCIGSLRWWFPHCHTWCTLGVFLCCATMLLHVMLHTSCIPTFFFFSS